MHEQSGSRSFPSQIRRTYQTEEIRVIKTTYKLKNDDQINLRKLRVLIERTAMSSAFGWLENLRIRVSSGK